MEKVANYKPGLSQTIPFVRLDPQNARIIKQLLNNYHSEEANFKPTPSQVISDLFISLGVEPEDIVAMLGPVTLQEAYGNNWKDVITG